MSKTSRSSLLLCGFLVAISLVTLLTATGCNKSSSADSEKKLRDSFNTREKFDPSKLAPEQRAGYEKAMKQTGAPSAPR
jgi:ABC-type oligopeptide transport system substrate-binding subunit